MNKRFRLNTTRLILRNFKKSDDFINYFEILTKRSNKYLAIDHSNIKIKDIFLKTQNYKGILVGIFLKNNKENIGTIGLSSFNKKYSSCNIGILTHVRYQRKGYSLEAMRKIIRYCHSKLKVSEIYLWVQIKNLKAIKLYKKLGFSVSKSKKKHYFRVKPKKVVKELFMLKKND